jgi:LysR family transcriptional activator of glutamate synthase operon
VELRQLVYFEAVVRHGGFSRASQQLHVAQPAISAQIRRLEAELGVVLLSRTTRHVALTPAGEMFLARARAVLQLLDVARAELGELTAVLRGTVRIGATAVLGPLDLPAALAGFRRHHPSVALSLRSGLIAELCAALDRGELDVVLGPVHDDLAAGHAVRYLGEESVVLATASGYRLGGSPIDGRHPVDLESARDEPFVCLPRGSGLRKILSAAGTRAGFVPRVEFEADTPASVRGLVAAGLGVALLAESAATGPGPAIDVLRLRDAPGHPPIGCILPQDGGNPAAQAFLEELMVR